MIFPNLILNKKNWDFMVNAWEKNMIPNAIIFHGTNGSGKEAHAIEYAALLNCNKIKNKHACGNCFSCKKIKAFQHENIKLILPLPRGKIRSNSDPEDKAFSDAILKEYLEKINLKKEDPYYSIHLTGSNTILINSIRSLKSTISLSTINNSWKIIIIFNAEKLCIPSPEAAHSLLKILEEPPEKTLFILVTSNSNILLDTIHSRCQSIYFPPITTSIIEEKISQNSNNPIESAIIARIASGNMRMAIDLNTNAFNFIKKILILIDSCFSNDPEKWSKSVNLISKLKLKNYNLMEQMLNSLILFFRDLLYFSNTGLEDNIIFRNNIDKIKNICKTYIDADWDACIMHIEYTQLYISKNGYLPIQITCMFLDIQQSIQGKKCNPSRIIDWN